MLSSLWASFLLVPVVLSCPTHDNNQVSNHLSTRQVTIDPGRNATDWSYQASYDWGRINRAYYLCQNGSQQSPIALGLNQGLSRRHTLSFDGYPNNVTGNFYNWGYGPAFSVQHSGEDYSTLPPLRFDDVTAYLKGWHIHTPADHSVGGVKSRAELHLVHVDRNNNYRAVVAIRLDPGPSNSTFFSRLPQPIGFNSTQQISGVTLDMREVMAEVGDVGEYWTYKGSLTSPPCTEGVQWFMARTILFMSDRQMQAILGASTYSARAEQEVWLHEINV